MHIFIIHVEYILFFQIIVIEDYNTFQFSKIKIIKKSILFEKITYL